jgi:hypothetical protein
MAVEELGTSRMSTCCGPGWVDEYRKKCLRRVGRETFSMEVVHDRGLPRLYGGVV